MILRRLYEKYLGHHYSGVFRQIPLSRPGRLFTSPMPYGAYDPGNRLLRIYRQFQVEHVFMLVTDEELRQKARRDLHRHYTARGMTYSQYPLRDFQAPALPMLKDLVTEALDRLQTQTVAIHCHAGVGRTAIAVACVARCLHQCSAHEALRLVQNHMDINLTESQKRTIKEFQLVV